MSVLLPRDKRRSRMLFDWTARSAIERNTLDAITGQVATFTRASVAASLGSDGSVVRANHSQWRTQWQDLDADNARESAALLLEPARTNAWSLPEDISNAAWTKTRSSVSANATIAPDGLLTADKLVEDASATTTHSLSRSAGGTTASTAQSFSFFAKAAERTWLYMEYQDRAGAVKVASVNLSTGAQGSVTGTVTFRVLPAAFGFWRVEFSHSSGVGATTPSLTIYLATGDSTPTYTGDGASGVYIWGLQSETDCAASSSYATATARVVDTLTYPFLCAPRAMTFYAKFTELGSLGLQGGIVALGDSSNPSVFLYSDGSHYSIIHRRAGDVSATAAAAPIVGNLVELRGVLNTDGSVLLGQAISSAAEVTTAASAANALHPTAWNSTVLRVNARQGGATDGMVGLHVLRIAAGVQTLATMREG